MIASAKYSCERRNYSFADYVAIHAKAHNELLELEEEVPEPKKVTDFLAGISACKMLTAKQIVLGNPEIEFTSKRLEHS
jgi:hypothetical protein